MKVILDCYKGGNKNGRGRDTVQGAGSLRDGAGSETTVERSGIPAGEGSAQ